MVGNLYEKFPTAVLQMGSNEKVFEAWRIERICCKRMLISSMDTNEMLNMYDDANALKNPIDDSHKYIKLHTTESIASGTTTIVSDRKAQIAAAIASVPETYAYLLQQQQQHPELYAQMAQLSLEPRADKTASTKTVKRWLPAR